MNRRWLLALWLAWLAVPLLPGLPLFWFSLANMAGIAALAALGLVLLTGIAGMTSFAQAAMMGFGAYAAALVSMAGYSPWLGLPAAIAASAIAALAIGAVTTRLAGHYLALATIAWAVGLYYFAANLDSLGRNDGISGIAPLRFGGWALTDGRAYHPVVWSAVGIALFLSANLLESRWGRAIRALGSGAAAASSMGVRLAGAKLLVFVYAAALAGAAGWLYAHWQRAVNPTPFGLAGGITYLLMVVAGGIRFLPGAIAGAVIVTVLQDRLQTVLPLLLGSQGSYETIVFGILLVALLQAAPEGLWPHLWRRKPRARAIAVDAKPLPRGAMPAPGTELLRADQLLCRFGGLVAVNQVSFASHAGEILGLIGPNGAGKSTTFNLLTGVLRPTSGVVRFAGRALPRLTPASAARLRIARSFQHVQLSSGMTVIENVALGAHLRARAGPLAGMLHWERAEESSVFAEAARQLARVGLAEYADRQAADLALGQQRIVEIARALCLDPVLLLLDEPAAGLRHAEKQSLAALLRQLRDEGLGIILVEHDMDFVMGLCGRLVVMEFGTRIAEGEPGEIRRDPAVIEAYLGAA
jgi:branched-chain amino acid transport system permease protein